MPQPYFVKGLIGKVLAYGGLQIRKYIPHGLQIPADKLLRVKPYGIALLAALIPLVTVCYLSKNHANYLSACAESLCESSF